MGRVGGVWVRKKIKKRAAGPTRARAEKKGGPGHGRHCIRVPHRMALGPFGGVYGTVEVAQCSTHSLYSHQGSCDI